MAIVFKNNARTTLAGNITNSATSIAVAAGSVFPTLSGGNIFYCTFDDGTNTEIVKVTAVSTNTLTIVRAQDNTTARAFSAGDLAELRLNAIVLDSFPQSSEGTTFPDNVKAQFGADNDLQIYHDGSDSIIADVGTGDLLIRSSDDLRFQNADGTETFMVLNDNSSVNLYFNNAFKLATTATGIDVTGTATMDGLTVDGSALLKANTATLQWRSADGTSNGYNIKANISNTSDFGLIFEDKDQKDLLKIQSNGDISFYDTAGTSQALYWDASTERLGIGTTSPNAKLDVSSATGSATITPTELLISSSTSASDWSVTDPWGVLGFYSADASGGGAGNIAEISANMESTTGGLASLDFKLQNSAQSYAKTSWLTLKNSGTFANRQVLIEADGGLYVEGKVGIGESDPSGYWSQANQLVIEDGNCGLTLKSAVAGNGRLVFTDTKSTTAGLNDGGMISYSHTDDAMIVQTAGDERLRINSTGIDVTGTVTATGGTSTNWNTAYGWGNHAGLYLGATAKAADSNLFDGVDSVLYQRYRADIGNAIDLNTYTTMGIYHQNSNAQAGTGSNYPISQAGMLTVTADGLMVYQTYQGYATNSTYERKYYSGTWQAWHQVYDSSVFTNNSANWNTAYGWGNHASASYATQSYVGTQISNLVDSSPAALNTLNELAAALGDDANFSTTVNASIAAKLPLAGGTLTGTLISRDITVGAGYHLQRSDHHSGHLEGSYNNVAANHLKSNPIYTIGSSYNPVDAGLSNMYGIGFTRGDASFLSGISNSSGWGLYAAASGTARVWLSGENGIISSTGEHYVGSSRVFHDTYHPNADVLTTARTISLTGAVTGSVSFNGSGNVSITTTNTADPVLTLTGDVTGSATFTNLGNATLTAVVANDSHTHSALYERTAITFGTSQVQWMDQSGVGGTGMNGAAPRNPANGWYHNLIMNHANSAGYYSQISLGLNTDDMYFSRVTGGTASAFQRIFADNYHPNADVLTTARTIAGTSFNGSANIAISYNNLTNIPTNRVIKDSLTANSTSLITTFTSAAAMNTASGSQSSLQVYNPTSGNDAFITFHVSGDYAFYFGLDGGTNKLSVGGWSLGANSYEIYHAGNKPSLATLGYTGATNANYITNNNQLTNGAGYTTNTGTMVETGTTFNGTYPLSFRIGANSYYSHGNITYTGATGTLNSTGGNYSTTSTSNKFSTAHGYIELGPRNTSYAHIYTDRPSFYFNKTTLYAVGNLMWTAGNDGSGSGLDADSLDGYNPEEGLVANSITKRDGNINIQARRFIGGYSLAGDGQASMPFKLAVDQNSWMVATASDPATWGLFWAGSSGARYGTNGLGGPGNIWSNSANPNEFTFVGGDSTAWTVQGSTGDSWQKGTARTADQGILWGASNDGSGSGLDADTVDGIQGASFLRSDADDSFSGGLVSTARDEGIFGTYNSTLTDHIWSMGAAYKNHASGTNFGNMYGFSYKHTNNATGGTMASGHQAVWCQNGSPKAALGTNIWTSGNVTAYSDIRVKTNIEHIPNALDKVCKLNGYTFDRTDFVVDEITGIMPNTRQTGVIAQEVLEILPEAVTGTEEGHYSVAYGNMVGLLIESIKELKGEVDDLKKQLEAK